MRTVVGLFDRFDDAQQAVRALNEANFERGYINLVARDATGEYERNLKSGEAAPEANVVEGNRSGEGAGIGAILGGLGGLLIGLGALAIPGIGPVLAAGPLVSALVGTGAGAMAGGLVGGLIGMGIPEEHAHMYAEGIRRGATLVSVSTQDDRADEARQILNRFHPLDLETHARDWEKANWAGFDDHGKPLSAEEMEFNRRENQEHMPVSGSDTTSDVEDPARPGTPVGQNYGWGDVDEGDEIEREPEEEQPSNIPVTGTAMPQGTMMEGMVVPVDWEMYDQEFRSDYETRYASTAYGYEHYMPAYRMGYDLARTPRYRGLRWDEVQPEAEQEWQRRGMQGAFADFRDVVHHAWDVVTSKI